MKGRFGLLRLITGLALLAVVGYAVIARPSEQASPSTAQSQSTAPSRCIDVPSALVDAIESGLQGNNTLASAAAVKSRDYENVWMVAAVIEGEGLSGDAGVWATNDLSAGGGLIFSVDGFANSFSDWGRLEGGSIADDGAREAKACAESR